MTAPQCSKTPQGFSRPKTIQLYNRHVIGLTIFTFVIYLSLCTMFDPLSQIKKGGGEEWGGITENFKVTNEHII